MIKIDKIANKLFQQQNILERGNLHRIHDLKIQEFAE
jgi:hypothetical protein